MAAREFIWRVISLVANIATIVYNSFTKKSRNYHQQITNAEISEQARYLCEKYIQGRFKRAGNKTSSSYKSTVLNNPELCSDDIVKTLCEVGQMLECAYPDLYNNVTGQLNFRINLEIVVCGMFTCVCDNILADGVTWARIVSLHVFAAALATECCQTDVRIAKNISKWMGQYTNKRLCPWIRVNGGWDGLTMHFCEEKYCFLVAATKWAKKVALPLSLGAFTGLAGMLAIWTGS